MESDSEKEGNSNDVANPKEYLEIVRSLIYAMTCTRLDISRIVSKLAQTLAKLRAENLVAAKHVLRFLKGNYNYELHFSKTKEDLKLIAFSDSDVVLQGTVSA